MNLRFGPARFGRIALIIFLCFVSSSTSARPWKDGWVFSPSAGVANPSLRDIYDFAFNAPISGSAQIEFDAVDDQAGEFALAPLQSFYFENPLEEGGYRPEAGIEFRRLFGGRHDLILGVGAWEVGARSILPVVFPIQGNSENDAIYERRGTFSYTQFYLGWRFNLGLRPRRFNLFTNFTLHELFDIDYKENHVFSFVFFPGFINSIIININSRDMCCFF